MPVTYDASFNANEWFVILLFMVMHLLLWYVRPLFSRLEGFAYYIYGVYVVLFYDHTISVKPWDFYDVNDSSAYQWIDALSYIMYGPFSYFFIYLYVRLRIKHRYPTLLYLLGWSSVAFVMEYISTTIGLYHYEKGYSMFWSFPIYVLTLMVELVLYYLLQAKKQPQPRS